MLIRRPSNTAEVYEGIPSCFVGDINASELFPEAETKSITAELIYESHRPHDESVSTVLESDALQVAIREACAQYANNISPQAIEERFEDYLVEDHGLSVDEATKIFREKGIAPFISIERIFISEPLSAFCFDFKCFGEVYLDEHGFSFDIIDGQVEFVTPRLLMREGSYPASRHKTQAEQDADDQAAAAVE